MSDISQPCSPHALFKGPGRAQPTAPAPDMAAARPANQRTARSSALTRSLPRGHAGLGCSGPASPRPFVLLAAVHGKLVP